MLFLFGHYQCDQRECLLRGQNQAECCQGETAQPLTDAQKGTQGPQDGLFGTGRHQDKARAQNGR